MNKFMTYNLWLNKILPPSLNKWYSGQFWAQRAALASEWHWIILQQVKQYSIPAMDRISIRVKLYFPDKRRRDHSNFCFPAIKLIEDGLVKAGVILDDNTKYMTDSGMGKIMPKKAGKIGTEIILQGK